MLSFRLTSLWMTATQELLVSVLPDGAEQPAPHACPAGQHVSFEADPHGVVPGWQPQMPLLLSRQATPLAQQAEPQGVEPFAQQHTPLRLCVHTSVPSQHKVLRHSTEPGWQLWASPRKGRSSAAPTVAAAPAPTNCSIRRRGTGPAM
jgi:hypothetical protein